MTDVVETLQVGDMLAMARRQIERGGIHHLPVIDGDEHVIGLITYHLILEAWISHGHPNTESISEVAGDVPVDMLMEKAGRDRSTVSGPHALERGVPGKTCACGHRTRNDYWDSIVAPALKLKGSPELARWQRTCFQSTRGGDAQLDGQHEEE